MKATLQKFSVWVPDAKTVSLIAGKSAFPMNRTEKGWWHLDMSGTEKEIRYRFSIDGAEPVPDPRSLWQPEGVHGDSCVPVMSSMGELQKFKPFPLSAAVFYEMHIGTFTPEGTYNAAEEKLDYLAQLGITHIELMPLATFPGKRGWGYDGVSLYAPHPAYGTPQDLKSFIHAAHAKGIAVILDVVYNHLGPDGNYLPQFGPYFTDRWKTPWGDALNFDGPESDQVRAFFFENALTWLKEYQFDGLRLDAVHAIFDVSAVHFIEELCAKISILGEQQKKKFFVVAESDLNDPRIVRDVMHGGYGASAHWMDDFHHAIHAFFTGEKEGYYSDYGELGQIAKALRQGYVFDGQFSSFRKRRHGRPPAGITPLQLVVCSQNHDQIGNRAFGERLSMMLKEKQLKAIAALVLLAPFIPMLFQGEEWGAATPFLYFTDHENRELGKLVSEGRRKEFSAFNWNPEKIPDPQEERTFLASKLNWREPETENHKEMLCWYRKLISLRKKINLHAQQAPNIQVLHDEKASWLSFQNGEMLVLFNFSDRPCRIPAPVGDWKMAMTSEQGDFSTETPLPGGATVIYLTKEALEKIHPLT